MKNVQEPRENMLHPDVLRHLPLLSALNDDEISKLGRIMWAQRFARHETVIAKGSSSDALMFLLSGRLQVVDYTRGGREIGLNLFLPGSFFGELALIDGEPRSASVIAMEPSVVAYLPREKALEIIYGNPAIAEVMLKSFVAAIRRLSNMRAVLAIPNAHKRVCALLCHIKRRDEHGLEAIDNLPTQQQIAIMVNTSRETVSRTIADLESKGVLRRISRRLVVTMPGILEKLAGEDADGLRSGSCLRSDK